MFLLLVGPSLCQLPRNLITVTKLDDLSFTICGGASEALQSTTFQNDVALQKAGWVCASILSKLRAISEFCNFGKTEECYASWQTCVWCQWWPHLGEPSFRAKPIAPESNQIGRELGNCCQECMGTAQFKAFAGGCSTWGSSCSVLSQATYR